MRIVVVGASGNVGTSLLQVLAEEPQVETVVGVARRRPRLVLPKTEWAAADVVDGDLSAVFRGADAVVHLAWLIQPGRDPEQLRRVNVDGSTRVFDAVAMSGVPTLVYASSVGAYSPGHKDSRVDETWPTGGIQSSTYSRHKVEVERKLDLFEQVHPDVRVVRLRPALIFKREAATGIRRLFAGPFLPTSLVSPRRLAFVPDIPGLRVQGVHSLDVADAYRRAVLGDVRGAFNVAADPVLDAATLSEAFGVRRLRLSRRVARAGMTAAFRLHVQPSEPGWLDMGLSVPLMDTRRAQRELGWEPRHTAVAALRELLAGMADGAGAKTPPLDPATSGPLRVRELLTGVGRKW
jgi:UDP-glucose 4-epimerase